MRKILNPTQLASVSSPPPPSSNRDEIIAYVHQLSPLKRNKRDTMNYSTMMLQTSDSTEDALLYSPGKRQLLAESEKSCTPVKIRKFTRTSDGSKIIVNDITKISKPEQTEYAFQFNDSISTQTAKTVSIKSIMETPNNEGKRVTVRGKIIHMNTPTVVSSYQLKIASAFLADESGRITLELWEQHISAVTVGEVYTISPVEIR